MMRCQEVQSGTLDGIVVRHHYELTDRILALLYSLRMHAVAYM